MPNTRTTPFTLLVRPKDFSALPPAKICFIEPMYARLANELPEGREWLYEVKFDGYRCLRVGIQTAFTFSILRGTLLAQQASVL